jgi:putative NIF3 family GTP cyclohydrolase 1 type 2
LERRWVPRGSFVLSSHVGFDEVLTVGYNTVLAARLGIDLSSSICLQGYKGDPERKIGIVAILHSPRPAMEVLTAVKNEFTTWDSIHGCEAAGAEVGHSDNGPDIQVVAIMNAFHPEEVQRVVNTAVAQGWIPNAKDGSEILYLTGQAREPGLIAAMEKGFKVVCVGHRVCEEWGIRYLAGEVRREFPLLDVVEVFEDEEPPPPRPKKANMLEEPAKLAKKRKTSKPAQH